MTYLSKISSLSDFNSFLSDLAPFGSLWARKLKCYSYMSIETKFLDIYRQYIITSHNHVEVGEVSTKLKKLKPTASTELSLKMAKIYFSENFEKLLDEIIQSNIEDQIKGLSNYLDPSKIEEKIKDKKDDYKNSVYIKIVICLLKAERFEEAKSFDKKITCHLSSSKYMLLPKVNKLLKNNHSSYKEMIKLWLKYFSIQNDLNNFGNYLLRLADTAVLEIFEEYLKSDNQLIIDWIIQDPVEKFDECPHFQKFGRIFIYYLKKDNKEEMREICLKVPDNDYEMFSQFILNRCPDINKDELMDKYSQKEPKEVS